MGKFIYGAHVVVEFDDRVLAHLQMVISAKLRRGESLIFSWKDSLDAGEGRTAVWVHPVSDIVFRYYGGRRPKVNAEWIDALMLEANKPSGLQLVAEPDTEDAVPVGHLNSVRSSGHA